MKVVKKQNNSKMCVMCGLDNPAGVRAPFYTMEDGSVVTRFRYGEVHQSYPGRVHGGLIAAMLDELGGRALWAAEREEFLCGVTTSLETKYRKPVPVICSPPRRSNISNFPLSGFRRDWTRMRNCVIL